MIRRIDAWIGAAIVLAAATVLACCWRTGSCRGYALLWWVPLVPGVAALGALAIAWFFVRQEREGARSAALRR